MVDIDRTNANLDSTGGIKSLKDQGHVQNSSPLVLGSADSPSESVVPPESLNSNYWTNLDNDGFYDGLGTCDKGRYGADFSSFLSAPTTDSSGDLLSAEYFPAVSTNPSVPDKNTGLLLNNENPTLCCTTNSIDESTRNENSVPLLGNQLVGCPGDYNSYDYFGNHDNYDSCQTAFSLSGLLADAVNVINEPTDASAMGDAYATSPLVEMSDVTSSESESDDTPNSDPSTDNIIALPTFVAKDGHSEHTCMSSKAGEEFFAIKQRMKDQIRIRRESEGKGEIPASELFEAPKSYPLTKEEMAKNEARKMRNRKSANKSRIKRIQREQTLEKDAEDAEDLNTKLSLEVRQLKNLKRTLQMKLESHLKSGNCKKRRQCVPNNISQASHVSSCVAFMPQQMTSAVTTCTSGVVTPSFNEQLLAPMPSSEQSNIGSYLEMMQTPSASSILETVTSWANEPHQHISQGRCHSESRLGNIPGESEEENIQRIKDSLLVDYLPSVPETEGENSQRVRENMLAEYRSPMPDTQAH